MHPSFLHYFFFLAFPSLFPYYEANDASEKRRDIIRNSEISSKPKSDRAAKHDLLEFRFF